MSAISVSGLIRTAQDEVRRQRLRAENGIKHVAGIDRTAVGQSPKDVVWQRDKVTLWRYRNNGIQFEPPLFIVSSLISRSYVLDLRPGHSLVEWLSQAGFDVYLIDFGEPDSVDSSNTLDTYVRRYLTPAIRAAASATQSLSVLGYCMGGMLSLLTTAASPDLPVRNLICVATPIDFHAIPGGLYEAARRGQFNVDDVLDRTGNVPPSVLRSMFRLQRPTSTAVQYVTLWEKLWDDQYVEGYQAISRWAADHVPFPGALAREVSQMILQDNAFARNTVRLGTRPVDLQKITCSTLCVIAAADDLVPKDCSLPLLDLIGSKDKTLRTLPGGHIGLIIGRHAATGTVPAITSWLADRSNRIGAPVG